MKDYKYDISVVVPVYNAEKYVTKTLESLFSKRKKGLQIIIVNDGSTDNSRDLIAEMVKNKRDVLVIDQENQGLSAARHSGLKLAEGEYIAFLDSDDWLDEGCYEECYKIAKQENSDVLIYRSKIYNEKTSTNSSFYDSKIFDLILGQKKFITTNLSETTIMCLLEPSVARIIKRSYWDRFGLQFPIGLYYEDFPVHYRELCTAERITLLNKEYYFYRIGNEGKITDLKCKKRYDIFKIFDLAFREIQQHDVPEDAYFSFVYVFCRTFHWCFDNIADEYKEDFLEKSIEEISRIPRSWFTSNKYFQNNFNIRLALVMLYRYKLKRALLNFHKGREIKRKLYGLMASLMFLNKKIFLNKMLRAVKSRIVRAVPL